MFYKMKLEAKEWKDSLIASLHSLPMTLTILFMIFALIQWGFGFDIWTDLKNIPFQAFFETIYVIFLGFIDFAQEWFANN